MKKIILTFILFALSIFPQETEKEPGKNQFRSFVYSLQQKVSKDVFVYISSTEKSHFYSEFEESEKISSDVLNELIKTVFLLDSLEKSGTTGISNIRKILNKNNINIESSAPIYLNSLLTDTLCVEDTILPLSSPNNLAYKFRIKNSEPCIGRNPPGDQIRTILFNGITGSSEFKKFLSGFSLSEIPESWDRKNFTQLLDSFYLLPPEYSTELFKEILINKILRVNRRPISEIPGLTYSLHEVSKNGMNGMIHSSLQKGNSELLLILPGEKMLFYINIPEGDAYSLRSALNVFWDVYFPGPIDLFDPMLNLHFDSSAYDGIYLRSDSPRFGLLGLYSFFHPLRIISKENSLYISQAFEDMDLEMTPSQQNEFVSPTFNFEKIFFHLDDTGKITHLIQNGLDYRSFERFEASFVFEHLRGIFCILVYYFSILCFHIPILLLIGSFKKKFFDMNQELIRFKTILSFQSLLELILFGLIWYLTMNLYDSHGRLIPNLSSLIKSYNLLQIANLGLTMVSFRMLFQIFKTLKLNLERRVKYFIYFSIKSMLFLLYIHMEILFIFY